MLLFVTVENVDNMLRRAIVRSMLRPPVTGLDFTRRQLASVHNRGDPVFGLDVVRSPAKIAGWNESRIHDHRELKRENCHANHCPHRQPPRNAPDYAITLDPRPHGISARVSLTRAEARKYN